jgi:hypothetical protein
MQRKQQRIEPVEDRLGKLLGSDTAVVVGMDALVEMIRRREVVVISRDKAEKIIELLENR